MKKYIFYVSTIERIVDMTTFDRIKKLAKEHGMTLNEVNDKAGLGKRSIYRWKYKDPSYTSLKKVAKVLGVTPDQLTDQNTDLDSDDQEMLALFRKSTDGMTEEEKEKFKQSFVKLLKVAKDLNS